MNPLSKDLASLSKDKERIKQCINDFTIARERLLLLSPDNEFPEELVENITQAAKPLGIDRIVSFLKEATQIIDDLYCRSKEVDPQLVKFKEYIEQNYQTEKLTIPQTAYYMGMSKASLYRFLKKYGIAFIDHVNKVKIKHAIRMLKTTDESVSAIGYSCGFSNINYFIEVFKSETGVTPGNYSSP